MLFKFLHQIIFSLIFFINDRDNVIFSIGYLIAIVNPDPIEEYMNGAPSIVLTEQSILMVPMNHSPIPMHNDLKR